MFDTEEIHEIHKTLLKYLKGLDMEKYRKQLRQAEEEERAIMMMKQPKRKH